MFETSKVLGKRSGDIQKAVRQMLGEGLLLADDLEPVRGTRFWFNEDVYGEELDKVLESDQPAGQMFPHQRILAVAPTDEQEPFSVIGRPDLSGEIAWVVEWGGDGEVLVGMDRSASKREVDQLVAALRAAGMKCTQRLIGEILGADEVRRHVSSIEYARERGEE